MTGKRTQYSAEFKARAALEALHGFSRRDRIVPITL
jgi:transposase-like protein